MTRINEIRERAENASYGKWKIYRNEDGINIGTEEDHPQLKSPMPIVGIAIRATEPNRHIYISDVNAEFIANSHDDVEFLLGEVERFTSALSDIAHHISSPLGEKEDYHKTVYEFIDIAKNTLGY